MQADCLREKYQEFARGLAEYLDESYPDTSFYGFGSVFQNVSYSPSDLDGGIIVPGLITDKEQIRRISEKMFELSEEVQVPLEKINFNLIDAESAEDGRFLSYDKSYTDYLTKHAEVLTENNRINSLRGINFRYGTLDSAAFNFRRIRNCFLKSSHFIFEEEYDPKNIFKGIAKSLGLTESLPKKILEFRELRETGNGGEIVVDKYDAAERLLDFFPNLDISFFLDIKRLKRKEDLETVLRYPELASKVWSSALETFESIVKEYIGVYPPKKIQVETEI
jgi:hypothetical protein